MAAENLPPVALTVVTNDMLRVRDEALRHPAKATVLGPARVIPREFPGTTVAVLDIDSPKAVDALLEEVLCPPTTRTVALRGGKRFVETHRPQPLAVGATPVRAGGPVMVTGGFGGIGLTVAERLIRDHGAPIVLVGRTALPDRADWDRILRTSADATARRIRAVRQLEQAGGRVLTLAADVSNVEEMRAAKAQAEAAFGPLSGLVHAAGVVDDAPILSKSPLQVEDVFTPKVHGTQVLLDLFPDGALDWIALFSSTSTVTAPAGQVDYVAANAWLNAVAQARAGGRTRVTAINWGIWTGVGMAAEAMEARQGRTPAPPDPVTAPMIDAAGFDADGHRILTATWTTDRWFIGEHRTRGGDALLPGTGYFELLLEALTVQGEAGPVTVDDLTFLAPLVVPDGEQVRVRVTLPRSDTGYLFRVESAVGAGGFVLNAEASVSLMPEAPPDVVDTAALRARMPALAPRRTGPQDAHLAFGPRWDTLRATAIGHGEGLAELDLPATGADGMDLHPGLLDLATGWAMDLIQGYDGADLWVPVSYGHVRVTGPLHGPVLSHIRNAADNRQSGGTARFDITLMTPGGEVLVEIADFTIRRMQGAVRFGAAPAPVASGPRPLSPAEERLRHNLTQGITPSEGGTAFFRALATGLPQIVVSSLPLPALVEQAGAQDRAGTEASFDRPQLDQDYAAPETDVQKRLAKMWQDLLGVAQVGIDDSFFDLGGHSLIAVRLFAQVRKAFSADFPISVLFEAPTIRKIAALIGEPASDDTPAVLAPAPRRFTHLVPMHQGEGGPKTPFFLVAGMFGNVLNLRHLAHLLGTDRPFYGLQARGLYGDAAPHDSLIDAARDNLAELRQIQPKGPYLLGGFSGGGLTALEMAQQLTAAGEEVAALVMLDTPLPQRRPLTRAHRAAIHRLELRAQGLAYPVRWATNRLRWEIEKRRPRVETASDAQFHDTAIEAAFYRAIAAYPLRRWDGPLTLFRPPLRGKWEVAPGIWVSDERAYVTHDNDWTPHAPRVEVIEVPGDHDSMVLEPNVRVLAARLRKVIAAAERPRPALREAAE